MLLKNKKEKAKTEAQKEIECNHNAVEPFSNISMKKIVDLHKFIEKFLDLDSEYSNFGDEDESKIFELIGKSYEICTTALDISQASGTYEKSIEKLSSLSWDGVNLTTRMGAKLMLIRALRIKFSLPSDKESVIQAVKDIWTSEELKCFYEKMDLNGIEV
ncbi:MAG: hypothetical protein WCS27_00400 [Victivallaceae bacterium]